jgi:ParB family chromosome partitioning protein
MTRKVLGRGLEALITETERKEYIDYIDIDRIKPNRYQPREGFNKEKLEELISSIKEKGVVQPILVRKKEGAYELIAGERRMRAVKSLGVEKIPAIIKETDDAGAMELALIENIQREDLNAIEEARAYQRLMTDFGFTYEKIAQAVGKDASTVNNTLRLLGLPEKIQKFVLDDIISMGHARALLSVSESSRQMQICEKIIKKGLSVREAEQLVRPHTAARKTSVYRITDPHLKDAEEDLQKVLGTKVRIYHGRKRGRVVIDYFSVSDLDRIIGIIKR